MTGPRDSVLGIRPELSIRRFRGDLPSRYEPAPGPCKLEACLFTIDDATGRCTAVQEGGYPWLSCCMRRICILIPPFRPCRPEKAVQRRAEQRLVLERLTALSEGCAAVLLAGDPV